MLTPATLTILESKIKILTEATPVTVGCGKRAEDGDRGAQATAREGQTRH